MAKFCDICGKKIGLKAFRCRDGKLCKECYRLVSNQFTATITDKTLAELKERYARNAAPVALGADGFSVSRRVGDALLVDEERRKFALPGNRGITKEYTPMEIFPWSALRGYTLITKPEMTPQKLKKLAENAKSEAVVEKLLIRLRLAEGDARDIVVIPTPVRTSGFAFRKSYGAAMALTRELDEMLRAQEEPD